MPYLGRPALFQRRERRGAAAVYRLLHFEQYLGKPLRRLGLGDDEIV